MTREELRNLHRVGRRKDILQAVDEYYGRKCACCGSEDNLEYHHIVPLYIGGTNRPTNIVSLCASCHYSLHNGVRIDEHRKKQKSGGRKQIVPTNEMLQVFDDYLCCRITKSMASSQLGVKRICPKGTKWMLDELGKRRIVDFKNLIETRLSSSSSHKINKGDYAGWWLIDDDGSKRRVPIYADMDYSASELGVTVRIQPQRAVP